MGKARPISVIFVRAVVLLTTLSFILLGIISITYEIVRFKKKVSELREQLINNQKEELKDNVKRTIGFLEFSQQNFEKRLKDQLKQDMANLYAEVSELYQGNSSKLPEDIVKQMIIQHIINNHEKSESKNYFIRSLDGDEILNVRLKPKSLTEINNRQPEDSIIRPSKNEIDLMQIQNEGFVYQMNKLIDSIDYAFYTRIAYVKIFKEYGWYLGIEESLPHYLENTKPEFVHYLESAFNRLKINSVLVDRNGQIMAGSLLNLKKPESLYNCVDLYGIKVFNEINRVGWKQSGGFITYYYNDSLTGKPLQILTYFNALPDWGWICGASIELDSIEQSIAKSMDEQRINVYYQVLQILLTLLLTYVGIIILARYISRKLTSGLNQFGDEVNKAINSQQKIAFENFRVTEMKDLGKILNKVFEVHFQTLNTLATNEEKYRLITENSKDIIWVVNHEGQLTFVSSSVTHILGYTVEECTTKPFTKFFTKKSVFALMRNLLVDSQYYKRSQVMIADYEICDKNGKIILVEIGINPVRNEAGEFLFYMGFCRDVTENRKARQALMESENRYKLLADNIKDVIWTADLNLCTTYISPSVYALEGYKPEERKAKLMKEILTPESYSFVTDLMKNILLNYAEGKAGLRDEFAIFEVEIIRKNGSTFWAEVNASLMFDAEGNAFGINGVTRDITDRKETENALRISEQKLKELNATKDKFFSIIAHDLRNPFSSILGFSKELAENYDQFSDNERIALLHQIISAANGTYQLLANLLEWSMAQSGRMEALAETILISNLANEAIIELSGQAMRKKIILISRIASDIQAFADKGMIRTVLRNLVSNAIKFTPSGGTITIESCYEQSMVKVWISDTGVGMSESSIDKLFRIEEKVISKGTEGEKGNGLGLILCKNFIDQNGGRIWAVSSKLKGSIFYFTLPVKQTV